MKLAHAQAIVEELTETEGIDATVDATYSGRGMYGRETAAVSTRYSEDVFTAIGVLGLRLRRANLSVDNMGLGFVVY
jgi:hypothetical protein|tara:strand:- start:672 stop:902 length:231 start_codon:yes stop_codon:yes gene_type:complete